jgi:hypothetical protein
MKRMATVAALGLTLALAGCATLPPPLAAELRPSEAALATGPFRLREPLPATAAPVSTEAPGRAPEAAQLVSGLVLVWSNPDAAGLFVGLFSEPFLPWTHIGLVSVEPDGVFVYDTNAGLSLTAEGPATGHEGRGVQRIPYARYVESEHIFGLYALPPDVHVGRLLDHVRGHYARRTPFDARFDSADASALYCTELTAHAWSAAGAQAPRPLPARQHRSYNLVRRLLRIPEAGFFMPDQFVDPQRELALWGRRHTTAQIHALFAARRELALRLAPETPLGHLIGWRDSAMSLPAALYLRETPQRFVDAALAQARTGETPEQIRARVAALAERHFGPVLKVEARRQDPDPPL